jgi:hypothetical protein
MLRPRYTIIAITSVDKKEVRSIIVSSPRTARAKAHVERLKMARHSLPREQRNVRYVLGPKTKVFAHQSYSFPTVK